MTVFFSSSFRVVVVLVDAASAANGLLPVAVIDDRATADLDGLIKRAVGRAGQRRATEGQEALVHATRRRGNCMVSRRRLLLLLLLLLLLPLLLPLLMLSKQVRFVCRVPHVVVYAVLSSFRPSIRCTRCVVRPSSPLLRYCFLLLVLPLLQNTE